MWDPPSSPRPQRQYSPLREETSFIIVPDDVRFRIFPRQQEPNNALNTRRWRAGFSGRAGSVLRQPRAPAILESGSPAGFFAFHGSKAQMLPVQPRS
ncbi:hypothetical protein NDU88_001645 [Pleurodeles waltl]|uniref:Uncharacterized protein n=1 Tax=Pleurodeles waltl TaxID=8319 RepID=A0AAV7KZ52_PLEWA|nr:hypothetical protein NDU88_001645 [Pleurodeles waltl]